ncbi:hypothetical protein F4805DRAFT_478852 [Annulohypoxylon moriforme]|nr:hypothetical protein F4805DRAFT_478852 [Annulohypoxylon moriforme]
MTSYTSREPDHIPGSFPTDDMLPTTVEQSNPASSTSHPHHNKLHKREDPRGWVDQGKTTHGHQHTDSGVGLTDTNVLDYDTRSRANERAFLSNQPSLQGQIESNSTETKRVNQHEINRKPGVMTGAYSRLDENENYTHSQPSAHDSARQQTNVARSAVKPASGAGMMVSPETEARRGIDDANISQHGLRQSSDLEHDDPYWGDVPYGTGTYNTVTGHGSTETPAEGSVHPHGSQLSHDQERSFPLSTDNNALHSEPESHNSSKFKEGLAVGTAAGAGTGLAASKIPEKQQDRQHKKENLEEPASRKDDDKGTRRGSKIASLFHRDHKEKDVKPEKHETKKEKHSRETTPNKDDNPLTSRDAGAALAAASVPHGTQDNAHKHEKKPQDLERKQGDSQKNALYDHPNENLVDHTKETKEPLITTSSSNPHTQKGINMTSPLSEDMATTSPPSHYQARSTEHNDSKLGYGIGAAGLGAGAGYAIHEHVNRENKHKGQSTQPTYEKSTMPPSKIPTTQPMHSSLANDTTRHDIAVGSVAPVRSSEKKQATPQANTHAKTSHTEPNHRHQYYILPDGTPSGMNIGDHTGDKMDMTARSPSAARNVSTSDNHTGAKKTAAGAGVAGAGAAAHYAGKQSNDKNLSSEPRQAVDLGSSDIHDPYMATAVPQSSKPTTTSQHGQQHILKETMRSSKPSRDLQGDKNLASSPSTATAQDSSHVGPKAATAAAAGALGAGAGVGVGVGAAAHHQSKNDSDTNVAPSGTTREQRSATTSSAHAPHSSQHAATATGLRNRASTDSSHDGQYNVLASGTPSGINREHLSMAGIASSALKAGERVMHRCGKCGEENDITGYFHE